MFVICRWNMNMNMISRLFFSLLAAERIKNKKKFELKKKVEKKWWKFLYYKRLQMGWWERDGKWITKRLYFRESRVDWSWNTFWFYIEDCWRWRMRKLRFWVFPGLFEEKNSKFYRKFDRNWVFNSFWFQIKVSWHWRMQKLRYWVFQEPFEWFSIENFKISLKILPKLNFTSVFPFLMYFETIKSNFWSKQSSCRRYSLTSC